jgi:hypothetical protein
MLTNDLPLVFWFVLVPSTNKANLHDITEIFLSECAIIAYRQMSIFFNYFMARKKYIRSDDDEAHFVLDHQA